MQILLKLILFFLIANNTYSQFERPTANRLNFIGKAPNFKGKVKSVIEHTIALYDKEPKFNDGQDVNFMLKTSSTNSYAKTFYNKEGNINTLEVSDTSNILLKRFEFVYDNLGRIIEKNVTNKTAIKHRTETYQYDSLDRWITTIFYDTLDKPTSNETRAYQGNTVTTIISDQKGWKTVYTYQTNKTIVETFYPNGNTYYKSVETKEEDFTITTRKHFNEDGRKSTHTYEKHNAYEHNWEMKSGKTSQVSNDKISYKTNAKGDTIQIKTTTYQLSTIFKEEDREKEKIEEFVYDSIGNYIAKIEYYNGKAAYKTIRDIEYY
jgi:hypothetical protein